MTELIAASLQKRDPPKRPAMNTHTSINLSALFAVALAASAHATPGAGHLSVWGAKRWEQEFATPGFTQVTCGGGFAAGVRADGSVACWGLNDELQCRPPTDIGLIAAVDAGTSHVVALRQNGTVVCWGSTWDGRTAVPAGLSQVIAVAAGGKHTLALRADGSVVGWGSGNAAIIPVGLPSVRSIDACGLFSGALLDGGSVRCWGASAPVTSVPQDLPAAAAIACGSLCRSS